ncbi:MAG: hydroxyacylglutathione hydrolase [Gammaproteobacteria bacterium]
MIQVTPVPAFNDNYIWLITHNPGKHTAIVDPGDASPVLKRIEQEGLLPEAILITHHHSDHVGGVTGLLRHFTIPVYGPERESIPGRTHALKGGDKLDLPALSISFDILDVPGHTSGAIAYYGHGMVFVGDTLFMSGCGRLFEGTAAQMHHSLGRLAQLPDETLVYCAHEYTLANLRFAQAVEPGNPDIKKRIRESESLRQHNMPTVPGPLALEKRTNPFLRVHLPEIVQTASHYSGHPLREETDVFAAVRQWKDSF